MIGSLADRIGQSSEADPAPSYLTLQFADHSSDLYFFHFNMLVLDHTELLFDHPLQLSIILHDLLYQVRAVWPAAVSAVVARFDVQVERADLV